MRRPPPISTLFPYTTLFRSDIHYKEQYDAYIRIFNAVGIEPIVVESDTGIMGGKIAHEFMYLIDRKSTRLNSSHVRISYAVFCLKNKNRALRRGRRNCNHAD